jgi:hypothetical protein
MNFDDLIKEGVNPDSVYRGKKKSDLQTSMPRTVGRLIDEFRKNVSVKPTTKNGLKCYLPAMILNTENEKTGNMHFDKPLGKVSPEFVRNRNLEEYYNLNTRAVIAAYL